MSDCGVCIGGDFDSDGRIEMFESKRIRARKEHICLECRRTILRGAECERISGKWEGTFMAEHTCMDCVNIRDGLSCGEPVPIGALWDEIDACNVFEKLTTACIGKIETASAKAYLIERWQRWKGLIPQTAPSNLSSASPEATHE